MRPRAQVQREWERIRATESRGGAAEFVVGRAHEARRRCRWRSRVRRWTEQNGTAYAHGRVCARKSYRSREFRRRKSRPEDRQRSVAPHESTQRDRRAPLLHTAQARVGGSIRRACRARVRLAAPVVVRSLLETAVVPAARLRSGRNAEPHVGRAGDARDLRARRRCNE